MEKSSAAAVLLPLLKGGGELPSHPQLPCTVIAEDLGLEKTAERQ